MIELKRDAIPKVVLNKLYKHTPMQTTFGVNMVALVDGVPQTLSLREAIDAYVDHQREVVVRRTKYELRRAEAPRPHPRGPAHRARQPRRGHRARSAASRDRDTARDAADRALRADRRSRPTRSSTCACAQLTALEADKIRTEHADMIERISELREILGDEDKVLALIKEELHEIAERLRRRAADRDHRTPRTRSTSRT